MFDRYGVPISLKQSTRERREGGVDPVCYRITDGTVISKISMKKLLSHSETKQQITEYFGKHLLQLGEEKGIVLLVSFNDECHLTIRNVSSLASTQEEADIKILLHAAHASKLGATWVDIVAADTDVLVLTIRRFPELCKDKKFITKNKTFCINHVYDAFGPNKAAALPAFHAFS